MIDLVAPWRPAALLICLLAALPAGAQSLPALNAPITESSMSGFDAGGYMAGQFAMAWASQMKGIGIVGAGPFGCALDEPPPLYRGLPSGPCAEGPPPFRTRLFTNAEALIDHAALDPLNYVRQQKIFVFHGSADKTLGRDVAEAGVEMWQHLLGPERAGNLFYQGGIPAGHAMVTDGQNAAGCAASLPPFVAACGYDLAGNILRHIYGVLAPAGQPVALQSFEQARYTAPYSARSIGFADNGLAYIPAACAKGAPCRVHVVLHGCLQDAARVGPSFATEAGYNGIAEANNIIVLYPQTTATDGDRFSPINPAGCWDWWGHAARGNDYLTRNGRQITALHNMLMAVSAGERPVRPPPSIPGAGPTTLDVLDTTPTSVALVWDAVPGAASYRLFRGEPDGRYLTVGIVYGTSYADTGLQPDTRYRWRVVARVRGTEGVPSPVVATSTKPSE